VARSSIGGVVFNDLNGNGVRDNGEPGLGGATITLRDAGNNVVGTRVTGADGAFSFSNLSPGNYTVSETNPSGYTSTTPDIFGIALGATLVTVNFGDRAVATLTPTPTQAATPIQTFGTICTLVWNDLSGEGDRDPGEPLLAGAQVTIRDSSGVLIASFTTNGTEPRCFSGLTPDTYSVQETDPAGYTSTTTNIWSVALTAGATVTAEFGDQAVAAPTPTPTQPPTPTATPTSTPCAICEYTVSGLSHSKEVAVDTATDRVWIVSRDNNKVLVVNGNNPGTLIASVGVGNQPFDVTLNTITRKAYVSNFNPGGASSVTVINMDTFAVLKTISLAPYTEATFIRLNTLTNRGYVAIHGAGGVAALNTGLDTLLTFVPTGGGAFGLAVNHNINRIYVTNRDARTISVVNGATNLVVETVPVPFNGSPFVAVVNLNNNRLYVTYDPDVPYDGPNRVAVYQTSLSGTGEAIADIGVGGGAEGGIAFNNVNNHVYVTNRFSNSVTVIRADNSIAATVNGGNFAEPFGVGVNPNTNRVYVGNQARDSITVFSDVY